MTVERERLDFLDGVRGLAATYVVFGHAAYNLPQVSHVPLAEVLLKKAGGMAHYSVDVFIVLSGYCLMLPLLRANRVFDTRTFLLRRAWRILPPYFFAMALSLALIATLIGSPGGTHWDVSIPVSFSDVVWHSLLFHDWIPETGPKINHAHWSIGVEWKIYFLFPLLLLLRAKFGVAKTAVLATLAGYLAWAVCAQLGILNPSPWGSSFYYTGLFTMGMFAAEQSVPGAAIPGSATRVRTWRWLFVVTSLAVVAVSVRPLNRHVIDQFRSLFVGVWAIPLLVCLRDGYLPSWFTRMFTARPIVWLGTIGYSSYLIHAPLLELCWRYLVWPLQESPLRAPVMVAVSLLVTIVVSYGFYRVAELPFHERSRRVGMPAKQSLPAE